MKGKKVKTNQQQKSMTFEPYSSLKLVFSPPVLSSEVLFGVRTAKGYTASSSSSSCLGWGGSGLATPKNCVIKFIEQQQAVCSRCQQRWRHLCCGFSPERETKRVKRWSKRSDFTFNSHLEKTIAGRRPKG